MGHSDEERSSYVREEIEAAQIADDPMLAARQDGYFSGYRAGWLAHQGDCDPGDVGIAWRAGWLASEMTQVDQTTVVYVNHDPRAWPWSVDRPIAGQYEALLRAAGVEANTPSRHLDGWTGPDEVDDQGNPLTAFAYSTGMDDVELCDDCDDPVHDGPCGDTPLTVSIDAGLSPPAVQINGLYDATAVFTPDEAEALADNLLLGADAARQATQDGYHGPAVVMGLEIGEGPESGVDFEIEPYTCTAPHDGECALAAWNDGPMVCVMPLRARKDADDRSVALARARVQDDADEDRRMRATAEPVDPSDPTLIEVDEPPPSPRCLDRLTAEEAAECAALSDSDLCQACGDEWSVHGKTCSGSARQQPTVENCKLLGAERCEHGPTAEERGDG